MSVLDSVDPRNARQWRPRTVLIPSVAAVVVAMLATVRVVAAVAWTFFALNGLPIQPEPGITTCFAPTPSWLP